MNPGGRLSGALHGNVQDGAAWRALVNATWVAPVGGSRHLDVYFGLGRVLPREIAEWAEVDAIFCRDFCAFQGTLRLSQLQTTNLQPAPGREGVYL